MEVTFLLMIFIGLVTYLAWFWRKLHKQLMLNTYQTVHGRQYYRLFTSGFVHNNPIHLFLNLLTLYFFGLATEKTFVDEFGHSGIYLYLLMFLSAIVVANIPSMLKYKDNPNYNSLGASGGVSALVLSFILFDPLGDLYFAGVFAVPGYILGALFIVDSMIKGRLNRDNINHDAHLFGALYGAAFTLIAKPEAFHEFWEILTQ